MKFQCLAEALKVCAESSSPQEGFRFLNDSGEEHLFMSFTDLMQRVQSYAWVLQEKGIRKGHYVLILVPEQQDFIVSFYACAWLGAIPVPLSPPYQINKIESYLEHLRKVAITAGAKSLIVSGKLKSIVGVLLNSCLAKIIDAKTASPGNNLPQFIPTGDEDTAFLQFTSGSTSDPKGVIVSNRNIFANCKCIAEDGLRLTSEDYFFSWLPFYHDMGLIGFVITPVIYRCSGAFISPLAFIKRPKLWLKGIDKYRATISFAPNFAYGLAVKRMTDSEACQLDLKSWRVAGCGAEPIQVQTVEAFINKFQAAGFDPMSFKACYGMAESTLAVSFQPIDSGIKVREDGRQEGQTTRTLSCGKAFPNHSITVRTEDGGLCKDGEVGEIAIAGPSVTDGYINNDAATREAIREGWLYTGDMGYQLDGDLYVCGRRKELIIISGRNYYPSDIEAVVNQVVGVRPGNVVAFGTSENGAEKLVIACEKKSNSLDDLALTEEISGLVYSSTGVPVSDVVLLLPGTLPKTTSGKLKRSLTREMYLKGTLALSKGKTSRIVLALKIMSYQIHSRWCYLRARVAG